MEKIELSKRLQKVTEFVKRDEPMLDIGSDHAYVPIYLVQENLIPNAIAGEFLLQPYENAKRHVALHGFKDKISTRYGSGFDVLNERDIVGTAVICGMGGLLIADIIEKGLQNQKISQETRLVLQPNNNQRALRKLLMEQQFLIEEEVIVKENQKYSEIIVASLVDEKMMYSKEELVFGPIFLEKKPAEFLEKWQQKYNHNQMILQKLDQKKHHDKIKKLTKITKQIGKVIA